jgi:hypothetical protein
MGGGGGGGGGGGLMGGRIINWRQLEKATRNGRGEVGPTSLAIANGPLLCASGRTVLHRSASLAHSLIGQAQLTYPLSCLPGLCLCVLSCKAKSNWMLASHCWSARCNSRGQCGRVGEPFRCRSIHEGMQEVVMLDPTSNKRGNCTRDTPTCSQCAISYNISQSVFHWYKTLSRTRTVGTSRLRS